MYKVVGYIQNNLKVVGYSLVNLEDESDTKNIGNLTLEEMVKNGEIESLSVITLTDGHKAISGIHIENLEKILSNRLTVTERKLENGKVVGYRVKRLSTNGENELGSSLISISKAWLLSADGCIDNLEAKMINVNGKYRKLLINK